MQVKASLKNLRISPRKTRSVTDLIKGLDIQEALIQLDMNVKRAIPQIKKLLLSAVSNGENNFGVDKDNMYIFNIIVGAGPTLKRWMPKAYGRAGQIRKRTSKVEIILEERVEGKGRKSKEQIEKEKRARMEDKMKTEKERKASTEEKKEAKSAKKSEPIVETEKGKKPGEKKVGLTNRIFRRKSM